MGRWNVNASAFNWVPCWAARPFCSTPLRSTVYFFIYLFHSPALHSTPLRPALPRSPTLHVHFIPPDSSLFHPTPLCSTPLRSALSQPTPLCPMHSTPCYFEFSRTQKNRVRSCLTSSLLAIQPRNNTNDTCKQHLDTHHPRVSFDMRDRAQIAYSLSALLA